MASHKTLKSMQVLCIFFILLQLLATTAQSQTNNEVVSSVQSAQTEPRQILIIDTYQPGLPIPESIRSGILAALREGGFSVGKLFIEHLDFARAPTSENRTDIVNLLRHKLAHKRIGIVITIGAPATDFIAREGKSLFPDAMVLALISPNHQALSSIYNRVVNIPWRVDPSGTLRVALDLYPKTRRVFVVTGANDTILPFMDQARKAFAPWKGKLEIEYSNEMTYEEMLRRVAALPPDAIVIYSPFFTDSTGHAFVPAEVVVKVCKVATVPVFATLEEYLGHGIVGGSLLKTMDIGRQAGKVALDYLDGRLKLVEPVTTLETDSLYEFDWRVLDQFKTDISGLPKDSIFINRPVTMWGQYKVTVIAASGFILVMGLLVVTLTIMNRRLRQMTATANDSEARFRIMIDQAPEAIVVYDVELKRIVDANPNSERLFGCEREELLQGGPERFYAPRQPDEKDIAESMNINSQRALKGEEVIFERNIHSYDGRDLACEVRLVRLPYREKQWVRASFFDITKRMSMEENLRNQALQLEEELVERQMAQEALQEQTAMFEEEIEEHRRTEEALQRSKGSVQNKLRAILEPGGDIGSLELSDIVDCEILKSMLEDFYKITGMLGAVLDVSGKVLVAVGWQDICTKFHRCHPDTLRNCIESDTTLTNGVPIGTFKHYRCKNNMWDMVTPLVVGGKHVGNVFIGQFFYDDEIPDVEVFREQARRYGFDEKEYLAALDRVPRFSREVADAGIQFYAKLTSIISTMSYSSIKLSRILNERIHLEEQLRQSQKMEAVGQLAGGIAHDFNNVLQVISGYGYMLQMDDKLDEQQKERIDHIISASEKAAQLTRGLLAFSRKQVMTLKPVNVNDIIENVKKFLVRIIGEDIQLKTITYENLLKIYVDVGQIEQVLINLATNARDAMQKGGLLTIETGYQAVESPGSQELGGTEPGHYAVVTVSDTGCGMDKETCKRIFEPFYTTKEVGKGTGLGMAIVYGIVKQHNGFINVYSEPGQGTTFRIYIPIFEFEQSEQDEKIVQVVQPQGGTETILLAEDDVDVRNLVVSFLTTYGYDVIQAVDGQDVVDKFTEHRDSVSMILMDMIMPKKNGKEAYEEILLLNPEIKVLYSSGYTADFIKDRGVSEEGIELIMKPVQPMELLRKVREVLDR